MDGPAPCGAAATTELSEDRCLAIQQVESLPPSRWPEPGHPSVSHLDTSVGPEGHVFVA